MKKVAFVCGENACRSQMAEAIYNSLAKYTRAESAGTNPADEINPLAVESMREAGIDLRGREPREFDFESINDYERIVSFGCIVKATFPGNERLEEWLIEDPKGKEIQFFRRVRDEIRARIEILLKEVDYPPACE